MTTAPERPKKRAGRTGYTSFGRPSVVQWMIENATICGECFGHREVWCPDCAGFDGCSTCQGRTKVRCRCAGGLLDGWKW